MHPRLTTRTKTHENVPLHARRPKALLGWLDGPDRQLPAAGRSATTLALLFLLAGACLAAAAGHRPGLASITALVTEHGLLLAAAATMLRVGHRAEDRQSVGLVPRDVRQELLLGLGACVVGLALVQLTVHGLNGSLFGFGTASANVAAGTASAFSLLNLVTVVVSAPLLEELVCRGLLQTVLLQALGASRRGWVVVAASAVFAMLHIPVAPWAGVGGLFVLGLVLGSLYERTGSLMPCVVAHAGFNIVTLGWVWISG